MECTIYRATVYFSDGNKRVIDYGEDGLKTKVGPNDFRINLRQSLNNALKVLGLTVKHINLIYDEKERE